ncbi:hypothetical protein AGMMS50255_1920 [Spirochaetia bacterium]|nr:hypothetical protein AGMMS50255_1920 [Spirochaetia bacterium]
MKKVSWGAPTDGAEKPYQRDGSNAVPYETRKGFITFLLESFREFAYANSKMKRASVSSLLPLPFFECNALVKRAKQVWSVANWFISASVEFAKGKLLN